MSCEKSTVAGSAAGEVDATRKRLLTTTSSLVKWNRCVINMSLENSILAGCVTTHPAFNVETDHYASIHPTIISAAIQISYGNLGDLRNYFPHLPLSIPATRKQP